MAGRRVHCGSAGRRRRVQHRRQHPSRGHGGGQGGSPNPSSSLMPPQAPPPPPSCLRPCLLLPRKLRPLPFRGPGATRRPAHFLKSGGAREQASVEAFKGVTAADLEGGGGSAPAKEEQAAPAKKAAPPPPEQKKQQVPRASGAPAAPRHLAILPEKSTSRIFCNRRFLINFFHRNWNFIHSDAHERVFSRSKAVEQQHSGTIISSRSLGVPSRSISRTLTSRLLTFS